MPKVCYDSMKVLFFCIVCFLATACASYSPVNGCFSGDTFCADFTAPMCCNATASESCYQGYQRGICCQAPTVGCCGYNGNSAGGCICRGADQQCCGNYYNNLCKANETCCGDPNGVNTCCAPGTTCCSSACCTDSETCSAGVCVPKSNCPAGKTCTSASGSTCCGATQSCFQGYQSGVCCEEGHVGCCGYNGYALGGCICRNSSQICCGNLQNNVCNAGETCCGDPSGANTCCSSSQTCSNGVCVDKAGICPAASTVCVDASGTKCCDSTQTCFNGFQSGVCCNNATQSGCCGLNGYALGGCKCRQLNQQCCGNLYNDVCNAGETCCGSPNGPNTCCASGLSCCGGSCCAAGQVCTNGTCTNPSTGNCQVPNTICITSGGSICCNSTQSCHQGTNSGICCDSSSEASCCGLNGVAIGGCKCRSLSQQCCGNIYNTICNIGETCCGDLNGTNTCCPPGGQCCGSTCCSVGQVCSATGVCVSNSTVPPPTNSTCSASQTVCPDGASTLCCNSTQSCFTGFQSGVCCADGQSGCCGNNGFAIGGCTCRGADSTCCGNMFNTICGPNTCCCGNSEFASCCAQGESCCFTLAEPLSNHQCCKAGDLCSLQFGCFTPNSTTPSSYFADASNGTICSNGGTTGTSPTTGTTTTGSTTGSSGPLRKVTIQNNGDFFKVVSTAISSSQLDNWDVVFQEFTGDAGIFEAYLSYFTQTNVNKSILDFKTRFYSVIEFVESGQQAGYQPGQDTLVQRYTLTTETWEPFNGPTQFNNLIQFSATTTQHTIGISGYVSENLVTIPKSNLDLTPNEIKFDVLMDFTHKYKQNNTQIALEARIKTWTKVAASTSDNFVTFFGDENAAASFSWVTVATAGDNTLVPVIASNLTLGTNPNEPEFVIYFTFATPKHTTFNWDPTVAVGQRTASDPSKSGVATILPFYTILFSLVFILCKYL